MRKGGGKCEGVIKGEYKKEEKCQRHLVVMHMEGTKVLQSRGLGPIPGSGCGH